MAGEDFAAKLIALRKKKKISQEDLGNCLGISNRAVSKWERGISQPTLENLYKLSVLFNKPVDYFIVQKESHTIVTENGMRSVKELFSDTDDKNGIVKYRESKFEKIVEYCNSSEKRLWQYAEENEDSDFFDYMTSIWDRMKQSIHSGLFADGVLPGGLGVLRKAKQLYNKQHVDESSETRENRIVCSYAFAVSEQNACGEAVVPAPTRGAAGVVPAVLYYQQNRRNFSDKDVIHALETAGIIGNLIKTNASTDGQRYGCQVEIGTACAMAAAALAELYGFGLDIIEYAAEIAIEHHLGLTCEPISGLEQIPCIERNAVAAMRAINAVNLASFLSDTRKISLDKVIKAMRETGENIALLQKDIADGGFGQITI